MQDEAPTNREKLVLLDNCATKFGRRKREIRRNQYTGEELDSLLDLLTDGVISSDDYAKKSNGTLEDKKQPKSG